MSLGFAQKAFLLYDANGNPIVKSNPNADSVANTVDCIPVVNFNHVYAGSNWDRLRGNAAGGAFIQGPAADNTALIGNAVRTGGRTNDWIPNTDAEQGPSGAGSDDRIYTIAMDWQGAQVERVNSRYNILDELNTTYDNTTTTALSTAVNLYKYRFAILSVEVDKANTPIDMTFDVELSLDGTNYSKLVNNGLISWVYSDTTIGTGIERCYAFEVGGNGIQIRATATGTDATNTITVDNATLFLRN